MHREVKGTTDGRRQRWLSTGHKGCRSDMLAVSVLPTKKAGGSTACQRLYRRQTARKLQVKIPVTWDQYGPASDKCTAARSNKQVGWLQSVARGAAAANSLVCTLPKHPTRMAPASRLQSLLEYKFTLSTRQSRTHA
jgi:hypothetical protein